MTWLDDLTLSTVIVVTVNGHSLKGLKAAVYDDSIVLRDVTLLDGDAVEVLNGQLAIPREQVAYLQLLE